MPGGALVKVGPPAGGFRNFYAFGASRALSFLCSWFSQATLATPIGFF